LNKKWNLGLEQQLRLENNSSEVDEYFTQLEASYKVSKKIKLGGGLRFIRFNDNQGDIQGYENHFRFNLDATYKHKVKDLDLSYRLRYQNKNNLGLSTSQGDYANQNIRLKVGAEYNIKKWPLDPKFSAEIFNHFEKEDDDIGFTKYRLTFGTDYKIKKVGTLGIFYRYQKDIGNNAGLLNILGLKFIYNIKNKK